MRTHVPYGSHELEDAVSSVTHGWAGEAMPATLRAGSDMPADRCAVLLLLSLATFLG